MNTINRFYKRFFILHQIVEVKIVKEVKPIYFQGALHYVITKIYSKFCFILKTILKLSLFSGKLFALI